MPGELAIARERKEKSVFNFRPLLSAPGSSAEATSRQVVQKSEVVEDPAIKKASRLSGFPPHVVASAPFHVHSIIDPIYDGPIYDVPLNTSDNGEGDSFDLDTAEEGQKTRSESDNDTDPGVAEDTRSPLALPLPTTPSQQKENAAPLPPPPPKADKKGRRSSIKKRTTPTLRPDPEICAQRVNDLMKKTKEKRRIPLGPVNKRCRQKNR